MQNTVDRAFFRLVAYKRIATGIAGLAGGVILTILALTQGRSPTVLFALGIVIFVGGGAWALRDGLRMRALLKS